MKSFILMTALLNSIMIMNTHPITLVILIIIQTLNICMAVWMLTPSPWFAYTLFLIFLGGLMVLFIYISSMASNEKFNTITENKSTMIMMIITTTPFIFMAIDTSTLIPQKSLDYFNSMILSPQVFLLTLFIMSYLLVALIVAVKTASKFEGPLRNTIKTK